MTSSSSTDVVLKNPPCFRSGLMWGISMAAVIGTHRFRTTKIIRTSCDSAIGAFGLVGGGTWYVRRPKSPLELVTSILL